MTALSEEALLDLMAYADGELDGEAHARVEALIASDEQAARVVAEMQTLGECIRITEGERPVPDSVGSIVDHVMIQVAQIQNEKIAAVVPLPVRRRRAAVAATVSAAIALAAGWALFMRPTADLDNDGAEPQAVLSAPAPSDDLPSAPSDDNQASASATAAAEPPAPGVRVDKVEVPGPNPVSVFFVPAVAAEESANASSVIVWIGDTPP